MKLSNRKEKIGEFKLGRARIHCAKQLIIGTGNQFIHEIFFGGFVRTLDSCLGRMCGCVEMHGGNTRECKENIIYYITFTN